MASVRRKGCNMSERRPVTPTNREIKTASLHRHLQEADTTYPPEVIRGGFGQDNLPFRVLEALDSIQVESKRQSATAAQIAKRIDELHPPRPASDQLDSLRIARAIDGLKEHGYLTGKRVWGDSRRRLAGTFTTYYGRLADQQPIIHHK